MFFDLLSLEGMGGPKERGSRDAARPRLQRLRRPISVSWPIDGFPLLQVAPPARTDTPSISFDIQNDSRSGLLVSETSPRAVQRPEVALGGAGQSSPATRNAYRAGDDHRPACNPRLRLPGSGEHPGYVA